MYFNSQPLVINPPNYGSQYQQSFMLQNSVQSFDASAAAAAAQQYLYSKNNSFFQPLNFNLNDLMIKNHLMFSNDLSFSTMTSIPNQSEDALPFSSGSKSVPQGKSDQGVVYNGLQFSSWNPYQVLGNNMFQGACQPYFDFSDVQNQKLFAQQTSSSLFPTLLSEVNQQDCNNIKGTQDTQRISSCFQAHLGENGRLQPLKKKSRGDSSKSEKTMNSKNVLRAYQRAIFSFMKQNKAVCEKILGFPLSQLGSKRRQIMGNIQSISEIRNLWMGDKMQGTEKDHAISKLVRIMSLKFLREEAISFFTFNNFQIKNILKYRKLLIKFLSEPENFIALML